MNLINREVLRERQKNRDTLLYAFSNKLYDVKYQAHYTEQVLLFFADLNNLYAQLDAEAREALPPELRQLMYLLQDGQQCIDAVGVPVAKLAEYLKQHEDTL